MSMKCLPLLQVYTSSGHGPDRFALRVSIDRILESLQYVHVFSILSFLLDKEGDFGSAGVLASLGEGCCFVMECYDI